MTTSAKKISHALNVMSSADSMRKEEFICDFKIKAGSKTFNAHRLILATNSGYFRSLFSSNMTEAQQNFVTIKEIKSTIMQQCIEYMYTSNCDIQLDTVSTMLHAANYLKISVLEENCFNFLQEILCPESSFFVLNLARTFNRQDVEEAAEDTIQKNLETVISSKIFKCVSEQDLLRYFSDANYEVSWKALTTWCEGKEKEFPKLAENLHFSQFPLNFLLETVLEHPLVKNSQNVKSLVIQSFFTDSSRLEANINLKNCFSLKRISTSRESEEVILAFMKRNLSSIITEPEFCSLSKPEVMSLLNSPEVKPEESKWEAILKWVKKDEETRKEHFADMLQIVKLGEFPIEFLKEIVRQERLVQADTTCMGLLVDVLFNQTDEVKAKQSTEKASSSAASLSPDKESPRAIKESQPMTELKPGTRVVRGPDWPHGDQDGNVKGTVWHSSGLKGWTRVRWDDGWIYKYRTGADGKYELIEVTSTNRRRRTRGKKGAVSKQNKEKNEHHQKDSTIA